MHDGLAGHLRKWGLKVEEKPGWKNRGRPYTFKPQAIVCHHTASPPGHNFPSEEVVTNGRAGLPGPLCQVLLGRDGTVKVIAGGYANHAGYGGPRAGIPENLGNTYSFGIEAENNGVGEIWNDKQLQAYYRLCAALLSYMGTKDVNKVFAHKEWAPRRKIDPARLDMDTFRQNVKAALNAGPSAPSVHLAYLKPGKRNKDVLRVKRKLAKRGYKGMNVESNRWGAGVVKAYAAFQRDLGYTGNDADGVPGRTSLNKLGFVVI